MSDTSDVTYADRGLFLSGNEYDWITTGLVDLIEKINRVRPTEGRQVGAIQRLMVRLKQITMAGQGMTHEIAERYTARIRNAMHDGKTEKISPAIAALLEAGLRLDPDPAQFVSILLAKQSDDMIEWKSRVRVHQWFGDLLAVLDDAERGWELTQYPLGKAMLAWIREVIEAGRVDVEQGHVPWVLVDESDDNGAASDDGEPAEDVKR